LWQFFLPLIIFVVAYWKILGVVRRQVKVTADRRPGTTVSVEPVAGTSAKIVNKRGASTQNEKRNDAVIENGIGLRERGKVGDKQRVSNTVSKAQINVVQTMVYITLCFTLCWMPMYVAVMRTRLSVRQNTSLAHFERKLCENHKLEMHVY